MKKLLFLLCTMCTLAASAQTFRLSLKQPGNDARTIDLKADGQHLVAADGQKLPLDITIARTVLQGGSSQLTLTLHARERAYYNIGVTLPTEFRTDDCDFYLPGFWYHKNLRSPREAPSFHTSRSWNVREDRLSSPLTAVYDATTKRGISVLRQLPAQGEDCLTTHSEGEVILAGRTTVGLPSASPTRRRPADTSANSPSHPPSPPSHVWMTARHKSSAGSFAPARQRTSEPSSAPPGSTAWTAWLPSP